MKKRATPERPDGAALAALAKEAARCRDCPLWERATQVVFGEGPPDARYLAVGEQPGDQEDRAGRPFVAIVLFTGGALFSLLEGVEKVRQPHEMGSWPWAAGVLAAAAVMEALSLRTAYRESLSHKEPERSWLQFVRRTKIPELPVVLLEDTGALVGLLLAFVGVTAAQVTGYGRFDAVGSLGIGGLLGVIALTLAREMRSFLIGESASSRLRSRICGALTDEPAIESVIDLRTEHLGPEDLLVVATVEVAEQHDDPIAAHGRARERLQVRVPEAKLVCLAPVRHR